MKFHLEDAASITSCVSVRVDVHRIEDLRKFVHESDVHITLGILNDLGSLGHADRRSLMGAVHENGVIDSIHVISDFGRAAGSNFLDLLHGMQLIARVDAFRRITREEIHIELKAGNLLHHRQALFFGDTGIDGALIDDNVTPGNHLAHGLGCTP